MAARCGKIRGWDDVINFGKHKGETVSDVFDNDATYLWWLITDTCLTDFPPSIKKKIKWKADDDYYREAYFGLNWEDFNT